jgi:hypothetical protein
MRVFLAGTTGVIGREMPRSCSTANGTREEIQTYEYRHEAPD